MEKTGQIRVEIHDHPDGTILVESEGFSAIIQKRAKTGEEVFEEIRAVILAKGLVFTEKIEKMARKVSKRG